MPKALVHDGDAVMFLPGASGPHGRPHLPAHVQMMVQAPPVNMTGRVVDTYHDAAQVRWDDGVTTVVHQADLGVRYAPTAHDNPSHGFRVGDRREEIFGNGDPVTYVPRKHHGKPHLPAQVQVMVQAPRRVGMTGIVVDTYHDAAQVQWDDGTMTVVHQMDLGASDYQGAHPGAPMHNPAFHEYGREAARKGENRQWREGTHVMFTPRGWIAGFYSPQHMAALPLPGTPGRVVSVRAGGRHSTTAGRDNSWVHVEWPNGAMVPVASEDLTRR